MFRRGCVWPILGLSLLSGCAAARHRPAPDTLPPQTTAQDEFPRAAQILQGIDPAAGDSEWRIGDRLLYGIRLQDGETTTTRYALVTLKTPVLPDGTRIRVHASPAPPDWTGQPHDGLVDVYHASASPGQRTLTAHRLARTITITTAGKERGDVTAASDMMVVAVDLYDEAARPIACSFACVPEALLRGGLYGYARAEARYLAKYHDPTLASLTPQEQETISRKAVDLVTTLQALYAMLWTCPNLEPILKTLITPPSLLSIIWHRGADVTFQLARCDRLAEVSTGSAAGTNGVLTVPVRITVNGEPRLDTNLEVLPPAPPRQLAGGVVGINARSVPLPQVALHVKLLAARRGERSPAKQSR